MKNLWVYYLVEKTDLNFFYPSENNKNLDLIIVVAIDDNQKIFGVTVYEDKKTHREGIK